MTAAMDGLRREALEAALELMPTPIVLAEAEGERVAFANAAARRMGEGTLPVAGAAGDGWLAEAGGQRLAPQAWPAARAAAGEHVRALQLEWHTPRGMRAIVVSADALPALHGQPAIVAVCFEDVSLLHEAGERVHRQAEELGRLYRVTRDAQRRKDESLALLDTLFATAPIGFAYLDLELRFVRVNERMARMNGVAAVDHIGRRVEQVLPGVGAELAARLERVLESGQPVVEHDLTGSTPAAPADQRHWSASYYPVRDAAGALIGVGAMIADVTERRRAEEERLRLLTAEQAARARAEQAERRWAFLAHAGALLASSLDHEETLKRVARVVVPDVADWCAVDVLAADGRIERLTVAHADPELVRRAWESSRRWPPRLDDQVGVGAVIRTGEAQHYPEVSPELLELAAHDEEHRAVMTELQISSVVIVPLEVHGRTLGALTLVGAGSRRFGGQDVELATELGRRVAVAVDNSRLYRSRSAIARTLQESLLPPHLPDVPGFEVAARYRAAGEGYEVGGDFYDVFEIREGCWAVVIGDVCGKGAEAAALTALARYTVRAAAVNDATPSRVLDQLNDAILRQSSGERFCTVAYAVIETGEEPARVRLACGGHPAPLLVRPSGAVAELGHAGLLLGVERDASYRDATAELAAGDALVLYTDGVSDAGSRTDTLRHEALVELVSECAGLDASALAARVEERVIGPNGGRPRDDLALLVLRARR